MRLTLQQMVANAVAEAEERTKLAQEVSEEVTEEEKKTAPEKKNGDKAANEAEKEKESTCYKKASVSSELVEKVASAVDYLARNIDQVNWAKVAQEAPEPLMGAGIGATAVPTNMDSPTPGEQSDNSGQAQNQPTFKPKDEAGTQQGQVNPQTALPTNQMETPGGPGEQPQLMEQAKTAAQIRRVRMMWKQAADAENPASLNAGVEPSEPPLASASEENVPAQPPAVNQQRRLIDTNQAAIDYTKGQAKAEPKRQMPRK